MSFLPFEQHLAQAWPPESWQELTVLLSVSGGADSVALLRAAVRLRPSRAPGRLIVAHYNHGLRGEASVRDESFVVDLCRRLDMPCCVERFSGEWPAREATEGLEAAARAVRYDFLLRTAQAVGARLVATAHTADDQVETILHRVIRGTGIAGLSGIPRARELTQGIAMVRPMLTLRRAGVLAYLKTRGQPYCHDATNEDVRQFTRNRLRHVLLPLLRREFSESVDDAVLRLGRLAGEAQRLIDGLVDAAYHRAVRRDAPECVRIARPQDVMSPYLTRELLLRVWREQGWPLRAMGMNEWDELAAMAAGEGRSPVKRVFPGGVTAERGEQGLLLTRR